MTKTPTHTPLLSLDDPRAAGLDDSLDGDHGQPPAWAGPAMLRRQHLRLWAGGALLGLAAPLASAQGAARGARGEWPGLRLLTPPGQQPIQLALVDIQAELVGRAVATRIEIHLHNPNPRTLEAELQFPLLDGQAVTGFALDIQGELRAAVPVEKARGREVFEAIVRRGVDPALLEATQGNHHKLRVYPLLPGGTRRVVLSLSETLGAADADAGAGADAPPPLWRLPLRLGGRVERLTLSVRCAGLPAAAVVAQIGAERLALQDQADGSALLRWSASGYGSAGGRADGADAGPASAELRVQLPRSTADSGAGKGHGALVSTTRRDGQTLFYAEVPLPAPWRAGRPRPRPAQVTLWWDASGSGAQREHALELAWLDAWLRGLGETVIQLVELRDVAQAPLRYVVVGGRCDALRARLVAMAYDGASQLGELHPVPGSALGVLVSDGLGNYGTAARPGLAAGAPALPVLSVSASADADLPALRRLAEAGGGACIDLLTLSLAQALALAQTERCRLIGLSGRGLGELEGVNQLPEAGRFCVAGALNTPGAELELQLLLPGGELRSLNVPVVAPAAASAAASGLPACGVAAERWAQMRLARLQADPQANRAAIRRLGQRFGLVTPETSLIVLETLNDYLLHDIEPPAPWRAEWQRGREQLALLQSQPGARLRGVPPEWAERRQWWATDYTHRAVKRVEPAEPAEPTKTVAPTWTGRVRGEPHVKLAPMPAPTGSERAAQAERAQAQARQADASSMLDILAARSAAAESAPAPLLAVPLAPPSTTSPATTSAMPFAAPPATSPVRPDQQAMAASPGTARSRMLAAAPVPGAARDPAGATTVIALQAWQPDSAALQRLRAAPPAQRYALYLDERPGHARSSAFYLDMAELFFAAGQTELGLRIVSNLAELALENRQLLRILAFRLLAAGQWRTALPVLERVMALAPDEPQSWRDLALACDHAGQHQRAVELLWEVGTRAWPRWSPGLAETALAELGVIAARHPGLDLRAIDPACLAPLPVALRVLLSWDTDDTDIDLWVVDPDGETCSFERRLTRQGGRLTADNTAGYGPEEFLLKVARPGSYTVQANYYGHRQQVLTGATTVMVQLSTDWGTPRQRDQQRVLRLQGQRDVVTLGRFSVGGGVIRR